MSQAIIAALICNMFLWDPSKFQFHIKKVPVSLSDAWFFPFICKATQAVQFTKCAWIDTALQTVWGYSIGNVSYEASFFQDFPTIQETTLPFEKIQNLQSFETFWLSVTLKLSQYCTCDSPSSESEPVVASSDLYCCLLALSRCLCFPARPAKPLPKRCPKSSATCFAVTIFDCLLEQPLGVMATWQVGLLLGPKLEFCYLPVTNELKDFRQTS